jgi:hypothetical protein
LGGPGKEFFHGIAGDVLDVQGTFCYKGEVPLVTCCRRLCYVAECKRQCLVVRADHEAAASNI